MPLLSRLVSALTVLALLPAAFAGELRVPESFDVLQVNDERYGVTMAREKRLTLPAGRHVIVLEYDVIFDASFGDSHDRVQSAPFAIVLELADDSRLQVIDPGLRNSDDAQRYAKAPVVQVRDAAQRAIAVQVVPVRALGDALQAVLPAAPATATASTAAANTSMNTNPPTAANGNVLSPSLIASATAAGSDAGTTTPAAKTAPDAAQMLLYWWQQATPEQRAAFLRQVDR